MATEIIRVTAVPAVASTNQPALPQLVERAGGGRHASPGTNSFMPSHTTRTRNKPISVPCGGSWAGSRGRGSSC